MMVIKMVKVIIYTRVIHNHDAPTDFSAMKSTTPYFSSKMQILDHSKSSAVKFHIDLTFNIL